MNSRGENYIISMALSARRSVSLFYYILLVFLSRRSDFALLSAFTERRTAFLAPPPQSICAWDTRTKRTRKNTITRAHEQNDIPRARARACVPPSRRITHSLPPDGRRRRAVGRKRDIVAREGGLGDSRGVRTTSRSSSVFFRGDLAKDGRDDNEMRTKSMMTMMIDTGR